MTSRYTGAIGKRFEGNLPRAHEVQGTARLLVQQCLNEIGHRGGWGQAVRQLALRDGTIVKAIVIKNIRGFEPIIRVEVFAPQGGESGKKYSYFDVSYNVWEPEGFFITPRDTAIASQGWGMPRLDGEYNPINAPKGTAFNTTHYNEWFAEGAIKQAIINRYEHNKYPDQFVERAIVDLLVPLETSNNVIKKVWPLFADPKAPLGVYRIETVETGSVIQILYTVYVPEYEQLPLDDSYIPEGSNTIPTPFEVGKRCEKNQFLFNNDYLVSLLPEQETEFWYCHWPEEELYPEPFSALRLEQFELVNKLRDSLGLEKLTLPIRGYGSENSDTTLNQVQNSRTLAHNSPMFDEGYQGANQRFTKNGFPVSAGENLAGGVKLTSEAVSSGKTISEVMFDGWSASPAHYATMTYPSWTITEPDTEANPPIITGRSGEFQFAMGGATIKYLTESYTGWTADELDPPISGMAGAQTFVSREQWVEAGTLYWENADESQRCSWFTHRPFRYALLSRDDAVDFCYNRFFYRGRRQQISTNYFVLGVAFCELDMTFRIGAYNLLTDSLDVLRLPREIPYLPESSTVDVETLGSYSVEDTSITSFSYMHFSQDGTKCVFAVASCADEPPNLDYKWVPTANVGYVSDTTYGPNPASQITSASTWGKLIHIEFGGSAFSVISTSTTTNTRHTGPGECNNPPCYDVFWWEFDGEFNIYADYVNNAVVFAKSRISYGSYWAETTGAPTMHQRVGWIKKELVYGDFVLVVQESGKYHGTFSNGALFDEGTLCELYHFDLRHVEDICYSKLTLPALYESSVRDGTSTPTTRKLYVRNELVWESDAVPRFTNAELGVCSRLDFGTLNTTLVISHDAPKAYPPWGNTTEPTSPYLALGAHYMNAPEQWEFWPASGFTWGPTPTWCIEAEGYISRHIPNDGAGFTMSDSIRYVRDPVITPKGPIGNYPSALPWVQRLSTDVDLPVFCTLHNTFGVFTRYKDKWIFTLRVDHFGAVPFTSRSLVPNGPEWDAYSGESYTEAQNDRIDAIDWSFTRFEAVASDFAENDSRWRTFSNIDLSTLVATDNLSQNIWPMGVM